MSTSPANAKTLAASVLSISFTLYLVVVCFLSLLATITIAGFAVSLLVAFLMPPEQLLVAQAVYHHALMQEMLRILGWLIIAGVVYAVHWRIFRVRVQKAETA